VITIAGASGSTHPRFLVVGRFEAPTAMVLGLPVLLADRGWIAALVDPFGMPGYYSNLRQKTPVFSHGSEETENRLGNAVFGQPRPCPFSDTLVPPGPRSFLLRALGLDPARS